MNLTPMVYGQKEQKFRAQDKNTTVHWKRMYELYDRETSEKPSYEWPAKTR